MGSYKSHQSVLYIKWVEVREESYLDVDRGLIFLSNCLYGDQFMACVGVLHALLL